MPSVRDIIKGVKDIKAVVSNELTEKQKEDFRNVVADPKVQKELQRFKLAKNVSESNSQYLGRIAHVEGINAASGRSVEFSKSEKERLTDQINAYKADMAKMLKDNPLIEKQFKYAEKHDLILPEVYHGMGDPEANQPAPAPAIQQAPAVQEQAGGGWRAGTTGAAVGPRQAGGDGKKISIGGRKI